MIENTIQKIELTKIKPSPTNPRKFFDPVKLSELADSVRVQGIIQPLLVRPDWCIGSSADDIAKLNGDADRADAKFFEIVAGERRHRAAALAKLADVPVIVRALGDQETLELQLIENLQRDDLDPFEEAAGYQQLLNLRDGHGKAIHTIETIRVRVGKPRQRVYYRLKLLRVPENVRLAVREGFSVQAAEMIGAIPTAEFREAAAEESLHPTHEAGPRSVRKVRELIADRYMRSLSGAPFDTKDASLLPIIDDEETGERIGGGACDDCPLRTGNMEAIIGKTKRPDVCTSPQCFLMKCDAQFARLQESAVKDGKQIMTSVEVAENFETDPNNAHFGGLRFDSKFVRLSDKPDPREVRQDFVGRMPAWKTILDGLPKESGRPRIYIARDPRGRVCELVERDLAIESVNLAAKQGNERSFFDRSARSSSGGSGGNARSSTIAAANDGSGGDTAWKAQDRKNKDIAKLNFQVTLAGLEALENAIVSGGAVKGFWDSMIEISVDHAGHDGCWLICKLLELDPEAKNHGTDRDGVQGAVLEYGLSLQSDKQKIGYLATLLLSKNAKIYNSGSFGGLRNLEVFKKFAKLYKIDINEIERAAKAKAKEKTKKEKKQPEAKVVASSKQATPKAAIVDPDDRQLEQAYCPTLSRGVVDKQAVKIDGKEYTVAGIEFPPGKNAKSIFTIVELIPAEKFKAKTREYGGESPKKGPRGFHYGVAVKYHGKDYVLGFDREYRTGKKPESKTKPKAAPNKRKKRTIARRVKKGGVK